MAVSLTWVRDNYDTNKNRYIDDAEKAAAVADWSIDKITTEELQRVAGAHLDHTLLPEYGTTPSVSLLWIRDNYDNNPQNRYIEHAERMKAQDDYFDDKITLEQAEAVTAAYNNHTFLPEYDSSSVTLEWVRDNYDTNKTRYVDKNEMTTAYDDYTANRITYAQYLKVQNAYMVGTLLPEYDSSSVSLEWIRDNYDTNRGRHIENDERMKAYDDYRANRITYAQYLEVFDAYTKETLLPEYDAPTPGDKYTVSFVVPSGANLEVDGIEVT